MSQYLIVNDVKCGYSFRAITLTNMLILLVLLGYIGVVWYCTLKGQWLELILPSIEKETFLRDCQLREGTGLSKEHRGGDIPEGLSTQRREWSLV